MNVAVYVVLNLFEVVHIRNVKCSARKKCKYEGSTILRAQGAKGNRV